MKEIGSNFWLDANNIGKNEEKKLDIAMFNYDYSDIAYLSSGRSAIIYALNDIEKEKKAKIALLPSYTCETVIIPFIQKKYKIYYYDLSENFEIDINIIQKQIDLIKPSVFLFHRYYGFDNLKSLDQLIRRNKKEGLIFIEDKTQSLFSILPKLDVDYIVSSFRKWGPIPDGGFCAKTKGHFDKINLKCDNALSSNKLQAFQLKYDYMEKGVGDKDVFLKQYQKAEAILDNEKDLYSMSPISKRIFNSLNIESLKMRRIENYNYVFERLSKLNSLKINLPKAKSNFVPLYIMLLVDDRTKLQNYLKTNDIYAPIIWPKPDFICDNDYKVSILYKNSICLPIDQRYSLEDMKRMCLLIENYFMEG